jgi:hypothetical protein
MFEGGDVMVTWRQAGERWEVAETNPAPPAPGDDASISAIADFSWRLSCALNSAPEQRLSACPVRITSVPSCMRLQAPAAGGASDGAGLWRDARDTTPFASACEVA